MAQRQEELGTYINIIKWKLVTYVFNWTTGLQKIQDIIIILFFSVWGMSFFDPFSIQQAMHLCCLRVKKSADLTRAFQMDPEYLKHENQGSGRCNHLHQPYSTHKIAFLLEKNWSEKDQL